MMISTKQPMLDDVKQDSPTTDERKPLLKCSGCKKRFKTTKDLERHSVLNCQNIKPSGNWSHYDTWEKRQKHRSNHANYIGSDMNSKEYFDQRLDSDSESSESSINSDIAARFDKLVDEEISTGSDEDEIARVNAWVEASIPQEKPEWYHMPDVSTPKTLDETAKKEPPEPKPTYSCNQCTQLTANEVSQAESLATDLMHNEPETISDISPHNSSRMNEYSMLVNANEESRLLHRKRLLDETISSKENEVSNTERVLAASRRIYLFDWISDYFIGGSLRQSNFFAMSFVGSGFKTLFLMLLLVFWNVTSAVLVSMYEFLAS